jgi:DNA-binding NarL/FixJ family response regulator
VTGNEHAERPARLVICKDHQVLVEGLAALVGMDPELELIAPPVNSPEDAVAITLRERPDVVLMGVEFEGILTGIDATRLIKEGSPDTNVVVMTLHKDDRYLVEAVEAGASGVLSRDHGTEEVLSALKAAARGESVIDSAALTRVLRRVARERQVKWEAEALLGQLTERETQILTLLAEGLRNDDIARRLVISPQTVQTHVRNILSKLKVHSRLEAVAFAARHGWITA